MWQLWLWGFVLYMPACATLLYPPLQWSWREWGIYWSHLVCLTVCGHNLVCSVSSTILAGSISYLHSFYCSHFQFSMMRPLNSVLNISTGFDQNCKFLFFTIFFSFCFSLSVCGSYHKPQYLLQSLWLAWNLTFRWYLTTSELIRFWSSSVDFPHFDSEKQAKFATSWHFLKNASEEWPEFWHADVSWPPSELIKFWPWSVDLPHFSIILT